MNDADIGIAPGPNETFGLAALELLASGTPVVVADRGALPEVIADRIGATAAPSGAAFADAVLRLAASIDEQVVAAARRHAEQFDWDVAARSFLDLFERLATTRRRQPVASAVGRSYL